MPDVNSSSHAIVTMIARCLSGHWAIEPMWLLQHADLVLRADKGEDMSNVWPKMQAGIMMNAGGIFAAAGEKDQVGKGQALGVINVTGAIYKYGWNSSKTLTTYLAMMAADERIGGVKLIVDSPGGMVHGTREVYEAISKFPKPVLSMVDGYMASAAYYLSAGSSRIVATQPNDQIGSIGTYQSIADWSAYYASIGLNVYDIYAKDSSEKNEEYKQVIESQGKKTDLAQKQLTAYNDQFLSDVKAGRGKKLTGKGQDPLKGRLFFPSEAIENGIIDELISEAETLSLLADMVATNKQSTIQMSNFKTFLNSLGSLVSSAQSQEETTGSEAPTVEQLTAQLTQLTTERDTAQAQITTLTSERDNALTQVSTLTGQITTLTTERDSLRAKVDEYGDQPGAMGTKNTKEKDENEGETKTLQQIIDGLPSEMEAAAMGL